MPGFSNTQTTGGYPSTYAAADAILQGRNRNSRKLANNTYAERRSDGAIAIRLHATDVATFTSDGAVSLDTGGWLTVTTKDRMNAVLRPAGYTLSSNRGRWELHRIGDWSSPVAYYADGMTIHADGTVTGATAPSTVDRENARNAQTRRDIARFVKSITPERIVTAWEDTGGDCFMCRFGMSTDCLADHVAENYFHAHLALRAMTAAGYRHADVIMSLAYSQAKRGQVDSLLTRALSKYLRKHLTIGAVAVA